MRDKFFKWLKRFFIVLPVLMMLMQIIFSMGSYWRDNATSDYYIGDDDFILRFVISGNDDANDIKNPLVLPYLTSNQNQSILYVINNTFFILYSRFSDTIITPSNLAYSNPYALIVINFLTWWVFVELVFLFFRFITFLISWVNSLFDRCFNKINKG